MFIYNLFIVNHIILLSWSQCILGWSSQQKIKVILSYKLDKK